MKKGTRIFLGIVIALAITSSLTNREPSKISTLPTTVNQNADMQQPQTFTNSGDDENDAPDSLDKEERFLLPVNAEPAEEQEDDYLPAVGDARQTDELASFEAVEAPEESTETEPVVSSYIVNANTGKFHFPSCSSVSRMKESNKWYYTGARDDLLAQGYQACQKCYP